MIQSFGIFNFAIWKTKQQIFSSLLILLYFVTLFSLLFVDWRQFFFIWILFEFFFCFVSSIGLNLATGRSSNTSNNSSLHYYYFFFSILSITILSGSCHRYWMNCQNESVYLMKHLSSQFDFKFCWILILVGTKS